MRFHKLDLNLLVALDALLTENGISRAAERMHMSQSAMSNALSRLRDYFGDPLLVQVGRKMELTPRAETLRSTVHDLLMRVDMTIAAQPEFDAATSDREFRILVSDYTLTTFMPHVLALAHAQSRSVRFLLMRQIEQPQQALDRSEADMLVFPKAYCSPDHPMETLWREDFVCVVCNRSSHVRQPLTFERYVAAGHVLMQPPDAQPSFESWFLQRYGVARRTEVTTFSFASMPALVVDTERIATTHRRLAEMAATSLPITLLPPPISIPTMEQALQWHKYRTLDPGLVWLRGLMHRAAARMDSTAPTAGRSGGGTQLPAAVPAVRTSDRCPRLETDAT